MTAQVHERLILNGETTSMAFCPPLSENHPRIIALDVEEARKSSNDIIFSTACWRGYLGTWEIREGRFYLVGLEGRYNLIDSEPLLAEWFSGVLRIPQGKNLIPVWMGFGSVYEKEMHIKIEKGMVIRSRTVDNRGKRHNDRTLMWKNLPGRENRFPGDDEL